jgi:protein TonB
MAATLLTSPPRSRIAAGALTIGLEAAVIALIALGFAAPPALRQQVGAALTAIDLTRPPTPPPPAQHHARDAGKAAPAHARAHAAPVAAATPPVALKPPPIAAAPVAARGTARDNGAALAGTGSGAGGIGNGTGSGGNGTGAGDGASDPELVKGDIRDSDFPMAARQGLEKGRTATEMAVSAQGRVTGCRVTRSSGFADLDDATCRLAVKRFRFRPAMDAAGRPIAGMVDYDQVWEASGPAEN